jgi:sulfonate transport system substrate-binding protein
MRPFAPTPPGWDAPPLAAGTAMDRRRFLGVAAGAVATLGLAACAKDATSAAAGASAAPLATAVPPGVKLKIASALGTTQLEVQLAGLDSQLPFTVTEWPNIAAGPDVINAFRANSLDVGVNAGIPPIQAAFQKVDAKIVAVNLVRKPAYVFATKPGGDIATIDDFKGRKLAFSQGQAQGVVLLRALKEAGLTPKDVDLVPLTSNQFLTALQASQVDIAPLALSQVPLYIGQYGKDGAHTITTDVVDLLTILWAPGSVLADPAKSAAVAAFVPIWAKSLVWVYEHPQDWIEKYYVATQNISADQAAKIIALGSQPEFPPKWDEAIAWEQESADLLASGGFVSSIDATSVFDRRFEGLTVPAVDPKYQAKAAPVPAPAAAS